MTPPKLSREEVEEMWRKSESWTQRGWWPYAEVAAICRQLLAMDEALEHVETVMMFVVPRSNTREYLESLEQARSARLAGEE